MARKQQCASSSAQQLAETREQAAAERRRMFLKEEVLRLAAENHNWQLGALTYRYLATDTDWDPEFQQFLDTTAEAVSIRESSLRNLHEVQQDAYRAESDVETKAAAFRRA